jgi:hypothetical protein
VRRPRYVRGASGRTLDRVPLLAGDGVEQQVVEEEDAAPLPPLQPRLDQVALAHEPPREADEVGHLARREALGEVLELLLLFHRALLLVDVLGDVLHALERLAERLLVRVALVGHREQLLEEHAVAGHALHRLDQQRAHVEAVRLGVRLAHLEVPVLLLVLRLQLDQVLLGGVVVVDVPRVAPLHLLCVVLDDRRVVDVGPLLALRLELDQELLVDGGDHVDVEEDGVEVGVREDRALCAAGRRRGSPNCAGLRGRPRIAPEN